MKAFDPNYKLLDEMYQDNYYPAFLVDKVKDELQKVIDLLENGETDTEVGQETLDALAEETPLERNGSPEDAARAAAFLCSEAADFITGQVVAVNGGYIV